MFLSCRMDMWIWYNTGVLWMCLSSCDRKIVSYLWCQNCRMAAYRTEVWTVVLFLMYNRYMISIKYLRCQSIHHSKLKQTPERYWFILARNEWTWADVYTARLIREMGSMWVSGWGRSGDGNGGKGEWLEITWQLVDGKKKNRAGDRVTMFTRTLIFHYYSEYYNIHNLIWVI